MTQRIRMWEVTEQDTLSEVTGTGINLERRLEDWLESDISVLGSDLLVVGRQVRTGSGGYIDLLCLDDSGGSVVVELKVGTTPWSVTSQVLDYAAWVRDLSSERLYDIAASYSKLGGTLEEVFRKKFGQPLPNPLNEVHRSIVVSEAADSGTERIVRYLSDWNVPISLATVQHFSDEGGRELLAQVFLVDPEKGSRAIQEGRPTIESIQELANSNGIGDLYRRVREGVRGILNATAYSRSVGYYRRFEDGGTSTVMFIDAVPVGETGGLGFTLHATRFESYFGISLEELGGALPEDSRETEEVRRWNRSSAKERKDGIGFVGAFRTADEIDKFLDTLRSGEL